MEAHQGEAMSAARPGAKSITSQYYSGGWSHDLRVMRSRLSIFCVVRPSAESFRLASELVLSPPRTL